MSDRVIPRSSGRAERRGIRRRGLFFPLVAFPCPSFAQRSGVFSPTYEAVVLRDESGTRDEAVSGMAGWPEGRLRSGMTALGTAREADPNVRRDRSALLQRRGVRGHLEKARQALRAAIGRLHEDAGRLDEAVRSYEAALALESNSQYALPDFVGPPTP